MPECVFVGLVSYSNMIPPCFFGGMAHTVSLRRICHACGALNPRFGSERLVYCNGIRAIQEPDASHELEQAYETAT